LRPAAEGTASGSLEGVHPTKTNVETLPQTGQECPPADGLAGRRFGQWTALRSEGRRVNAWFYSTVQFVFAGNDSQGLRYGTVGTPEKLFLTWKEDEADDVELKLDKYLLKMCEKRRFLELVRDFVLFDGGQKKLPRVHQYFGIKAAQERIARREGGIIWHTQGSGNETDKQFIYNLYQETLKDVPAQPGMTKTEVHEEQAKQLFKKEPATMKLLIVVDKLLTGFDAPSCTYLYIDKSMQDHGLFQAICRTNRLDGDHKQFGYIVDYMDLFKKVQGAIKVYSSELDHSAGGVDPEVVLQDRATKGRTRLDEALEAIYLTCEPVPPPQDDNAFRRYFCGNTEIASGLSDREPLRAAFYKACAALVRAFANIADDLDMAGYSAPEVYEIKRHIVDYVEVARHDPQRQRRDARPKGVRSRHAAPDRHLHRGEGAEKNLAVRRHVAVRCGKSIGGRGPRLGRRFETLAGLSARSP
jgi:type I site-specific restriction-modification system R (restriction) subunit